MATQDYRRDREEEEDADEEIDESVRNIASLFFCAHSPADYKIVADANQ